MGREARLKAEKNKMRSRDAEGLEWEELEIAWLEKEQLSIFLAWVNTQEEDQTWGGR